MMDIDFSAIITVTNYGRIQVDGSQSHNDTWQIEDREVIEWVKEQVNDLKQIKEGFITRKCLGKDFLDMLFVPIRYFENYFVFAFMCKKNGKLEQRDLRIAAFITEAIYENVMLDYEIVKERNYLQSIFDSTNSYIVTLDLNGTIIAANKNAGLLVGNQTALVGKGLGQLLSKDRYEQAKTIYQQVVFENRPVGGETEFVFGDGKKRYLSYTLSPMVDANKDVIGVVVLGVDVTKQKIYEKEIEQMRQYALLGEISAEVAHDIKNPLMGIRGCARLLQKKTEKQLSENYLSPIIQEVDRINQIVEQMLAYSKMTIDSSFKFVDVNALVDKCIDAVSFHKQFKQISIIKDYREELPFVEASDIRMQQALMNILLNAIQAINDGGEIRIKTQRIYETDRIEVTIGDNGIGIDEREYGKIFDPFYTTKVRGTGLGLPIAKKVLDEIGGNISIQSKRGQGTMIKMEIPIGVKRNE